MKRLIIGLILLVSACDAQESKITPLLALQSVSQTQEQAQKEPYVIWGGYFEENSQLCIFQTYNNIIPKIFVGIDKIGYETIFLIMQFETAVKEVNLNYDAIIFESIDYKWIGIRLDFIQDDSFIISGTVTDYDGNIITVKTPTITFK